jgi:hypothetical protein
MTTDVRQENGEPDTQAEVAPTYAGDPPPVTASPLILNDAYFELVGTNLRCLVKHLEVAPENKPVTVTSFCGETDYPGVTKWHLRVTFAQSFDSGATYDTLEAALAAYEANGQSAQFRARPYSSRAPAQNNPWVSGYAIPQPFEILMGDAGASSEVQIDWTLTGPPTVDRGAVAATGATAGVPGFYTPSGASPPANLAALAAVVASPATAWTTGQYVITADLLAAHYDGAAWAAGKAP